MRLACVMSIASGLILSAQGVAFAETCSDRAAICRGACTPALVSSGQQHGGTVQGCIGSCQSRLRSCLRTGIWVHMGAQNRGRQQQVDKR
jgi:hypothetical protein